MSIQNINIGSAANDGTGDSARVAGQKINANFQYLQTLVNDNAAVENSYNVQPNNNLAALYADQANQTTGKFQFVQDARTAAEITAGDDVYFKYYEYLGTTNGDSSDYRELTDDETQALQSSFGWKKKLIRQKNTDANINLGDVTSGSIAAVTDNTNITHLIFDEAYTSVLQEAYSLSGSVDFSLNIYNVEQRTNLRADITGWTEVDDNTKLKLAITGIVAGDLAENENLQFELPVVRSAASGGLDSISWQTAITEDITFSGTQKGAFNFYPVDSDNAVVVTIDKGSYSVGDVIPLHRKGFGTVEVLAGTDVRLNGKRDVNNDFFINDVGGDAFVQFSHLDGSTLVGNVVGSITGGYTGQVVVSDYSTLREGDTGVAFTITGTGLKDATVSFDSGIAINSVTSTTPNQMVLNVTVTGVENDTIDATFNNGDVITYADAITIQGIVQNGVAFYQFNETSGTTITDNNGNYNGTNVGATIGVTGFENNAYSFDGVDDYATFSNFGINAFPFSVELYLKASAYSGTKWIGTYNDLSVFSGFNIYATGTEIAIQFGDGGGTGPSNRKNFFTNTDPLVVDTWQKIKIVATDINNVTFEVDDVAQTVGTSGSATTVDFATGIFELGRYARPGLYGAFEIDELTIYDTAE